MSELPSGVGASLPRPSRRVPWWLVAMLPLWLAAGVATGRWVASSGARLEAFSELTIVGAVLGLPLAVWLVLLVHEAGHLAAARLQGWPFLLLLVGPLRVVRGASGLVWGLNRAWPTWGGLTASIPPVDHTFRRQMLLMVLAGPLASATLGVSGLWFFGRHGRDGAGAAHWIGLSGGGFVDPFQRPLAEAGLAWAEGRVGDARHGYRHGHRDRGATGRPGAGSRPRGPRLTYGAVGVAITL